MQLRTLTHRVMTALSRVTPEGAGHRPRRSSVALAELREQGLEALHMPQQQMPMLLDLFEPPGKIGLYRTVGIGGGNHLFDLGAQRRQFDRRMREMPLETPDLLKRKLADLAKVRLTP